MKKNKAMIHFLDFKFFNLNIFLKVLRQICFLPFRWYRIIIAIISFSLIIYFENNLPYFALNI